MNDQNKNKNSHDKEQPKTDFGYDQNADEREDKGNKGGQSSRITNGDNLNTGVDSEMEDDE
jgi:hypothetical protein